jgi:hypothetical protein
MAVNTFDSHLSEVGARLQELRNTIDELEGLLLRHTHNGYSGLASGDFAGRAVTQLQYNNAITSIDNLLNTWLPAGHGTNIDQYLYEVP